ncbi:MAG: T9SS type A sorting domain-containing protein [Bacteroidetes bacterium]|nr:T9SS type A sorting domain-containing protein [Bacteroidota bacterium]
MKKQIAKYWFASALSLIAFQTIGFSQNQNPDSATVTFKVNTAFVQDTVTHCSGVFITGGNQLGDWSLPNGIKLKSVGGDYWEGSKTFKTGSTIGTFKPVTQTMSGIGWDRHEYSGFTVHQDTTITIFATGLKEKYTDPVTGSLITRGDDWNPLTFEKAKEAGKIAVLFRVNMQSEWSFNPATHKVQVRGSFNEWSGSTELYPEVRHDDLGSSVYQAEKYFFSRIVLLNVTDLHSEVKYKFTYTNPATQWESFQDRTFTLNQDTTLFWKWFNGGLYYKGSDEDCGGGHVIYDRDAYKVHFKVDLDKAIKATGFDPQTDTLYVKAGLAGTGTQVVEIKLNPESGTIFSGDSGADSLYIGILPMKGKELQNEIVFYGYYRRNTNGEFEEFYFDIYDSTGKANGPKFRKMIVAAGGKDIFAEDLINDNSSTHRVPFFKNMNPIGTETTLTLEANLNPAIFFTTILGGSLKDIQGGPLVVDSTNISNLAVYINGPGIGGWKQWNADSLGESRRMNYMGLGKWSIDLLFDANAIVSQEFKLSIGGADNEANYGNRHITNLNPISTNSQSIQFGDTQPLRYKNEKGFWDFNAGKGVITSIEVNSNSENPNKISLSAYPNPFNPATLISFSIPQSGKVSLKVFDLLGRQVATLSEEIKPAGTHLIPFRGDDLASGIYMVRMESGSKTESLKVILLK